jgi:hypothetical protein
MELPKSVLAVIDLLEKTRGRDRIFRLLQYTFRFLTEMAQKNAVRRHFQRKETQERAVEDCRKIANTMASTRKILRFTKHYDIFLRISKNFNILANKLEEKERKPDFYYLLKILSDVFLFLYYITDHFLYFYFLEMIPKTKIYDKISWSSDFLWLLESIVDIMTCITDAYFHKSFGRMAPLRKSLLDILLYTIDSLVK